MSFEVEQKFRAANPAGVVARLQELGAAPGESIDQRDTYLSHPSRDFARTGEALRIRRSGELNAITYKGPRLAGPTKTRREYEVSVGEGIEARATVACIFEALGFQPVAEVAKHRQPYHLDMSGRSIEVVIDTVVGLGTFVEVEALARDEADLADAQAVVLDLAARLELGVAEPRSYLRMVLESRTS